jgi:hypothetical protein
MRYINLIYCSRIWFKEDSALKEDSWNVPKENRLMYVERTLGFAVLIYVCKDYIYRSSSASKVNPVSAKHVLKDLT